MIRVAASPPAPGTSAAPDFAQTGMAAVRLLLWRRKIHPQEQMLSGCTCVIWCSRDKGPPHPREIFPQGEPHAHVDCIWMRTSLRLLPITQTAESKGAESRSESWDQIFGQLFPLPPPNAPTPLLAQESLLHVNLFCYKMTY